MNFLPRQAARIRFPGKHSCCHAQATWSAFQACAVPTRLDVTLSEIGCSASVIRAAATWPSEGLRHFTGFLWAQFDNCGKVGTDDGSKLSTLWRMHSRSVASPGVRHGISGVAV